MAGVDALWTSARRESVYHSLLDANRWFATLTPPLPQFLPDAAGVERPVFELPERWPPIEGDRRI